MPAITNGAIAINSAVRPEFRRPAYGTLAPGDASRLYVVEQNGLLSLIQNGA